MNRFACYNTATGKIEKIMTCHSDDIDMNLEQDEGAILMSDMDEATDDSHYVDLDAMGLVEKAPYDMETSITMVVGQQRVIPLPEPCFVGCDGEDVETMFEVDDGTLELEFSMPGEYELAFESIHYRYPKVTVHVQED